MNQLDGLIVGAGFNGLYQLHRLRKEGFNVRLVEAGAGLGGVWDSNRYPGARVDSHVPNYEYSIEAVWRDWVWSERFPGRDELVRYFEHVDQVRDLRRDIDLNTRIESARFEPGRRVWHVVAGDRHYEARYLVMCTGFGSKPFIPDLRGLEDFASERHHTALWPEDGLSLAGKRVGVIGTGASGVQVVQEGAKQAERLIVFQRSPVTALPMRQRQLDPSEQAEAKAGYREMFDRRNSPPGSFCDLFRLDVGALEVTADERTRVFDAAWQLGGFHFWVGTFNDILTNEEANRMAYAYWRDHTRARIDDQVVAELLAPWEPPYPFGTKRPSLEQDYYECFNQPNVELVDLKSTPIETITTSDLHTTTTAFELDVLVLATGFDANTGGLIAIDIRGVDDAVLANLWADGVDTHLGVAVSGFPNMLILYGPQSPTAFCNGPVCAELQGDWTVDLFNWMATKGYTRLDSTAERGVAWTRHLAELANSTLFGKADSWYMGANVPGKKRQLLNYPSSDAYFHHLGSCTARGYEGFDFS